MKISLLIITILTVFSGLFAIPALAQTKDTNTNNIYCDPPQTGRTIKKTCSRNAEVDACYSIGGVDCNAQPIWDCTFEKISDRCENQQTQSANNPISKVFGQIVPPAAVSNIGFGAAGISTLLSNVVVLIYIFAAIAVLFMIVWGATEWIISGGDKEKVASARKRITFALLGLVLLSLTFVVLKVIGTITGIKLFLGG